MPSDLPLAVSAARGAGEILARAFRSTLTVEYKSADQPVTEADRAADRFLRTALLGARPDYGWLSEESEAVERPDVRCWVIDPLDGTRNFIGGRPEFAVCVGLLERGTPVLGVVYNPVSEKLYHATRGAGAYRGEDRIHARRYRHGKATLIASAEELDRGRLDALRPNFEVETLGSTALKMAYVAEGGADLYVSRSRKGIWDVCAAAVIATEAGATVRDGLGRPIDYSLTHEPLHGALVVAPGGEDRIEEMGELLRADLGPPEEEEDR